MNDDFAPEMFFVKRGVRQGDSLSPYFSQGRSEILILRFRAYTGFY